MRPDISLATFAGSYKIKVKLSVVIQEQELTKAYDIQLTINEVEVLEEEIVDDEEAVDETSTSDDDQTESTDDTNESTQTGESEEKD